jgi:hypothetical protein
MHLGAFAIENAPRLNRPNSQARNRTRMRTARHAAPRIAMLSLSSTTRIHPTGQNTGSTWWALLLHTETVSFPCSSSPRLRRAPPAPVPRQTRPAHNRYQATALPVDRSRNRPIRGDLAASGPLPTPLTDRPRARPPCARRRAAAVDVGARPWGVPGSQRRAPFMGSDRISTASPLRGER